MNFLIMWMILDNRKTLVWNIDYSRPNTAEAHQLIIMMSIF